MKTPTTEQWERAVDDMLSGGMKNDDFQNLLDLGVFRELGSANPKNIDMKMLRRALNPLLKTKTSKKDVKYVGTLKNCYEQGMEHHGYALLKDGHTAFHWENVEFIDDGDLLVIFDHDGKQLHKIRVKMVFCPKDGVLTAKGIPWRLWHSFFYPKDKIPFRAELTKKKKKN